MERSEYVKSYGHLCQILAFFYDAALQIWPCHVTQEANLKENLFFPNSPFNIRKVTKFLAEKLSTSEVISKNLTGGGKHHPPSAFRVKINFHAQLSAKHHIKQW